MSNTTLIALDLGYVESSQVALLCFKKHPDVEDFEKRSEAISSLAGTLLSKWMAVEDVSFDLQQCCVDNRGSKFCPECGTPKNKREHKLEGVFVEFEEYLANLTFQTADEYGSPLDEHGPWVDFLSLKDIQETPPEESFELGPYAERMLIAALRGDEVDSLGYRKALECWWENREWFPGEANNHEEFMAWVDNATSEEE